MGQIRQANESDLEYLLDRCKLQYTYAHEKDMCDCPDDEYITDTLKETMRDGVFLIYEDDEGPAGFICGFRAGHVNSPGVTFLASSILWVDEEKRASGIGLELIDTFKYVGKATEDIDHTLLSVAHNTKISDNTLAGIGFMPYERVLIARG